MKKHKKKNKKKFQTFYGSFRKLPFNGTLNTLSLSLDICFDSSKIFSSYLHKQMLYNISRGKILHSLPIEDFEFVPIKAPLLDENLVAHVILYMHECVESQL